MKNNIIGIQQIGIGIPDAYKAWAFYRKAFGVDVPIFEESAEANLMLPYTGGKPQSRTAVLAMNLQGGSGMEIWQYTSRTTEPASFEIQLGDLGIFITKIKSPDVAKAYETIKAKGIAILGDLNIGPDGEKYFFVKDEWNNIFQVVKSTTWFTSGKHATGGINGCVLGVKDVNKSFHFYKTLFGYDKVVYDVTESFSDFSALAGGKNKCRRMLLRKSKEVSGPFSKLLGASEIELIQVIDREPKKIFEGRFWGDMGFIHLCFDVRNMNQIKAECEKAGYPFTVDSASKFENGKFDMGEAAGHFSYIEDPDGTLIEFVETHKIPILKKLGWYLDVTKRHPEKTLPDWMLKALALNRKKD